MKKKLILGAIACALSTNLCVASEPGQPEQPILLPGFSCVTTKVEKPVGSDGLSSTEVGEEEKVRSYLKIGTYVRNWGSKIYEKHPHVVRYSVATLGIMGVAWGGIALLPKMLDDWQQNIYGLCMRRNDTWIGQCLNSVGQVTRENYPYYAWQFRQHEKKNVNRKIENMSLSDKRERVYYWCMRQNGDSRYDEQCFGRVAEKVTERNFPGYVQMYKEQVQEDLEEMCLLRFRRYNYHTQTCKGAEKAECEKAKETCKEGAKEIVKKLILEKKLAEYVEKYNEAFKRVLERKTRKKH